MLQRNIGQLGIKLSRLGFGVMRLPQDADGSFPEATKDLLHKVYNCGINYFDTGYEYLGGRSETLIRDTLVSSYPRDSFYIADKLPVWRVSNRDDMERIFATQLERLGTHYFDFYLLHAMNAAYWDNMRSLDVLSFLDEKKRNGQIRKVGFSFHDNEATLETILRAHHWDFCQLQINYYDWYAQHAKENYKLCEERGIPVMVMEPVGGGRLVKLPSEAERMICERGLTPPQLALQFTAALPNVAVTLTGAVTEAEFNENIAAVSDVETAVQDCDELLFRDIVKIIQSKSAIPCTACKYCVKECPRGVDIPLCFQKYNDYKLLGLPGQYANLGEFYFNCIPMEHQAQKCISCGKCARRCPQKIDIPSELRRVYFAAVKEFVGVAPEELSQKIGENEVIVCFGAGGMGKSYINILASFGYQVDYLCDNSSKLWGKKVDGIEIISPKRLMEMKDRAVVFISSQYYDAIFEQLAEIGVQVCNIVRK